MKSIGQFKDYLNGQAPHTVILRVSPNSNCLMNRCFFPLSFETVSSCPPISQKFLLSNTSAYCFSIRMCRQAIVGNHIEVFLFLMAGTSFPNQGCSITSRMYRHQRRNPSVHQRRSANDCLCQTLDGVFHTDRNNVREQYGDGDCLAFREKREINIFGYQNDDDTPINYRPSASWN